jgi:hypothetical protein
VLFLPLLSKRSADVRLVRTLARLPVGLWLYRGDEHVPLRQALRAFMTWLGDPRTATPAARRTLIDVVAGIAYTARVDVDQLETAVRAVFEPGNSPLRRAIGHPAVPITADAVVQLIRVRLTAVERLTEGTVTDDDFVRARQNHLVASPSIHASSRNWTTMRSARTSSGLDLTIVTNANLARRRVSKRIACVGRSAVSSAAQEDASSLGNGKCSCAVMCANHSRSASNSASRSSRLASCS